MARNVLVDAGFLVALLSRRDSHHQWAVTQAPGHAPPWRTCEAVLSEAFHLLGARGAPGLSALLRRRALIAAFDLDNDVESVLKLLQKYADVPMSLADACLVRMTETLPDPIILTTDSDFRIYRRHSRQMVPCMMPSVITSYSTSPLSFVTLLQEKQSAWLITSGFAVVTRVECRVSWKQSVGGRVSRGRANYTNIHLRLVFHSSLDTRHFFFIVSIELVRIPIISSGNLIRCLTAS